MDFEKRQEKLSEYNNNFKKWCEIYGYTGLSKEYYYNRFENGFDDDEKNNEDYNLLKNIIPEFHDDGYIINKNGQKITISRVLNRNYNKILKVSKSGDEICVYGPFGFFAIIKNKLKYNDNRVTINRNDNKFRPMFLGNFCKLYNIKIENIKEWTDNFLLLDIFNKEINNSSDEKITTDNNYFMNSIINNDTLPIILCKRYSISIDLFITNNFAYFIYNCILAIMGERDDRDDIKNKIITQKLFYMSKNSNLNERKKILTKFIEKLNSMNEDSYNNVSCRNKLDIWSSSRKVFITEKDYTSFSTRTLHFSFKKYLCPFETSDGTKSGLTTSLSCYTIITPGNFIEDRIKLFTTSEDSDLPKKKNNSFKFFFNGFFINNIKFSRNKLLEIVKEIKEVDNYSSIYVINDKLFIDTYPGRIMRWNGKMFICSNMEDVDEDIHPSMYLGFAASLIPFIHHNAGPRGIFMVNMMKQILMSDNTFEKSWLKNDGVKINTITTDTIIGNSIGINVLVKWAVHMGYNIEDGIVVTNNFISKNKNCGRRNYLFKMDVDEKLNEKLLYTTVAKKFSDHKNYDDNGVIKKGVIIKNGDVLASKLIKSENIYKKFFLRAVVDSDCLVTETNITVIDSTLFKIIIKLKYNFSIQIGDKMVSNSSQKGVISHIANDEDENIDLIINPCCIPSRMTLGQIYEGIITNKIIEHNLEKLYFPPFENTNLFLNYINKLENKFYENLIDIIPDSGYWYCYNRYYILGHRVDEKIRAIGSSKNINKISGQVVKGRKNEGGLRVGLMEKDAILAHKGYNLLNNMFIKHGDGIKITEDGKTIETTRAAINIKYYFNVMGYDFKIAKNNI
jgi:DNA-directed RNA polymerase beta subunit